MHMRMRVPLLLRLVLLAYVCIIGAKSQDAEMSILCPFFDMVRPDTESKVKAFLKDSSTEGNAGYFLLDGLHFPAVVAQKGFWAGITGQVLDLFRLDEIPGISHDDLYNSQFDGVKSRIEAATDEDGLIMLQDLVEIKEWVASEQNVTEISLISKGETVFLFLGAGGSLKDELVNASAVLDFLQSKTDPNQISRVDTANLAKGLAQTDWS